MIVDADVAKGCSGCKFLGADADSAWSVGGWYCCDHPDARGLTLAQAVEGHCTPARVHFQFEPKALTP